MSTSYPAPWQQHSAASKRAANDLMAETLIDVIAEQPFFCECDDPLCMAAVWLSREEYEGLRRQPGWRPLAFGHRVAGSAA